MATADFITTANGWEVGETRGPIKETIEAQADGALAKGDLVEFSGLTSATEGILKAKKATGDKDVRGMALFAADAGTMTQILIRGIAKPSFVNSGAVAVGNGVGQHDGKIEKYASGTTGACFGIALSAGILAGGDHLLIFFGVGSQ